MLFLGQASNYRARDVLQHTVAFGTKRDADNLRLHLAERYHVAADHVALYGTGRSALAAALKTTVSRSRGQHPSVIITALTCYAVVQAVKAAGFTPVFADASQETLHFGATELKAALKKHPDAVAVVVQNNLGIPCDISAIEQVATKHHLVLIEDLAHSAGIVYADGREAGTVGQAAILSFGKGKSIDTIAGGALVLRDSVAKQPICRPSLANSLRARWYPFFGALIRFFYRFGLGRYFTAALLKLHFIERSADAPLKLDTRCTYWQAKLALRQLLRLPQPRPPLRKFYLVSDRDTLLDKLEKHGFNFKDTWYDIPVAPERYFAKSGFVPEECPVATKLAGQIINFPTHYPKSRLAPAYELIKDQLLPTSTSKKSASHSTPKELK